MTGTCSNCGDPTEKHGGQYRDKCPECIQAVADARDPVGAHDCAVCGASAVARDGEAYLCGDHLIARSEA